MAGKELVGWQILHKLIENDIKAKKDVIIAVAHWLLIKNGDFLCLGTGDEVPKHNFTIESNSSISFFVSAVFIAENARCRRRRIRVPPSQLEHRQRRLVFTALRSRWHRVCAAGDNHRRYNRFESAGKLHRLITLTFSFERPSCAFHLNRTQNR